MSAAKKRRELNRATEEHNRARIRHELKTAKETMTTIAESFIGQHVKELESKLASRDAEVAELKNQLADNNLFDSDRNQWRNNYRRTISDLTKERDEWKARAEFSYKQRDELKSDLLNLVCRIHRDGGHYIAKYGEAKAIADADTVAAQNNADLDALQADNAELVAALEHYAEQDERNARHYPPEFAKEALATAKRLGV